MQKHLSLSLSLLLLLMGSPVAWGQLLVNDPPHTAVSSANLAQLTYQSAQATIQTSNLIAQTEMAVMELLPVEVIIIAETIIADLGLLAELVSQVEGLSNDVASLQAQMSALFGLDSPPMTSGELRERLNEIRRIKWLCYSYAMRLQTLIMTALTTVEHMGQLVNSILSFTGNMAANQTMIQAQHTMGKTLLNLQVTTSAYQRAESTERMEDMLTTESIEQINTYVWDRE